MATTIGATQVRAPRTARGTAPPIDGSALGQMYYLDLRFTEQPGVQRFIVFREEPAPSDFVHLYNADAHRSVLEAEAAEACATAVLSRRVEPLEMQVAAHFEEYFESNRMSREQHMSFLHMVRGIGGAAGDSLLGHHF